MVLYLLSVSFNPLQRDLDGVAYLGQETAMHPRRWQLMHVGFGEMRCRNLNDTRSLVDRALSTRMYSDKCITFHSGDASSSNRINRRPQVSNYLDDYCDVYNTGQRHSLFLPIRRLVWASDRSRCLHAGKHS
jgi:hypothetical protein